MRDFFIIGGAITGAVIIGGLLFYFGPTSLRSDVTSVITPSLATTTVPTTVLVQGENALSITDRTNYRITNANDFQSLWSMVYGQSDPSIPSIDFTKYEVLAVFDGSHSMGGYSVTVPSVIDASGVRTVTIDHAIPAANCQVVNTVSNPFIMIQVPMTPYSLNHIDTTSTTTAC